MNIWEILLHEYTIKKQWHILKLNSYFGGLLLIACIFDEVI